MQQKLLDRGLIIAAQQAEDVADVDSLMETDETGTRKRKVQKVDCVGVVDRLRRFYEEEIAKDNRETEELALVAASEGAGQTRNVQELKKRYRKAFIRTGKGGAGACRHCGERTKSVKKYKSSIILDGTRTQPEDGTERMRKNTGLGGWKVELTPRELLKHFRELWKLEPEVLTHLFPALRRVLEANCKGVHPENLNASVEGLEGMEDNENLCYPTDIFFTDVVAVPPPRTRPCLFAGGFQTDHPQSTGLSYVIQTAVTLKKLVQVLRSGQGLEMEGLSEEAKAMIITTRGDKLESKVNAVWKELQSEVDHVLDKNINNDISSKKVGYGFKQLIERKTGLFRMHMMGKRVNFAARTVITPDPNIAVDEIGLPEVFAKSLTYREPVTPFNVEKLRDMVLNGPDVHPGATAVEYEDGNLKMIDGSNPVQREALAKTLFTEHRSASSGQGGRVGQLNFCFCKTSINLIYFMTAECCGYAIRSPPPDQQRRHAAEPSAHPAQAQYHVAQGQGAERRKSYEASLRNLQVLQR